jgi:two-component system NarL family response regulator
MIRILCTDDHLIVREGISLIINQQPDMEVVAATATGEEAIDAFRTHRPDVTIMDLQLNTLSGVDTIAALRREDPNARIVVLTMYQGDEDVYRAMQAGASAYLFKDTISDDLIRVLREVHAGEHPVTAAVEARLAERASRPALTRRELEVLTRVACGMRNREIASELRVTEETVIVHVKNIFAKLDVKDRTAATHVALRRGIIHLQ